MSETNDRCPWILQFLATLVGIAILAVALQVAYRTGEWRGYQTGLNESPTGLRISELNIAASQLRLAIADADMLKAASVTHETKVLFSNRPL